MTRPRERHPWNADFRWALPDREPTTITPDQHAQLDRNGFFVLRGAFDPAPIAEVEADCAEGVGTRCWPAPAGTSWATTSAPIVPPP